jgi:serine phosphatase RsbU (regulator of sigma subunit)/tetratricopeptide (TPR) repeat protein
VRSATIILVTFLIPAYFQAQDSIDLLIQEHKDITGSNTTADFARVIEIANHFQYKNLDKSQYYAEEALLIAKELKDKVLLNQVYHTLGVNYSNQGDYNESKNYFTKALRIANDIPNSQKDSNTIIRSMRDISVVEMKLGHYGSAAEGLMSTLRYYEKIRDTSQIASIRNNLCVCYYEVGQYTKAIENCKLCMDLLIEINDTTSDVDYAYALVNTALSLSELGEHQKALNHFKRSTQINQQRNDQYNLSYDYYYMGDSYSQLDMPDSALNMYEMGMDISAGLKDTAGLEWGATSIGMLYITQGSYQKGIDVLHGSLDYYKGYNLLELKTMYLQLAIGYKGLNKWKDAFNYTDSARVVSDRINKNDYNDAVAVIQGKLDFAKQENTIMLNDVMLAEAKEKAKNQQLFIWIIAIILFAVVVMLLLILYSLNRKRKANFLISEQKLEVEKQRDLAEEQRLLAKMKSEEVEEKHKKITDSIDYGKKIQDALLTSEAYWKSISNNCFIVYQPKDVVSGDFHWAYQDGNIAFIIVADCTGHGVPGAFMSMLGIGFLNEIILENNIMDPAQILNELRNKIIKSLDNNESAEQQNDGMDICLCKWDKDSNELTYAGANNSLWLIRKGETSKDEKDDFAYVRKGETTLIEVPADPQPVGRYGSFVEPFSSKKIQLKIGDRFYAFSDGYYDQFGGPRGKKLKPRVMKELLLDTVDISMQDQKEILTKKHLEWKGDCDQVDDICIVGIEVS